MEHCRSSPGKQRSFDTPSVLFRLQVAEASLERERAKLHEGTKEQVQGEAFKTWKDWSKSCVYDKLMILREALRFASSDFHVNQEALMSRFCHIEILFLVKILWKDDPDCNLAIRQFLVWISVVIQDVERELAAERASSREAVGQSWLYSCCGFLEGKICRCSAAEHRHNSSWDSWRTSCCLRISNCEYCFYGALQKFSRKTKEFWCSKCSV